MTEREIQLLGFERETCREHDDDDSYYYVLDIVDGLTLISTDVYEPGGEHDVVIEIFNTEPSIRWDNFGELQGFINLLTNRIVHAK